MDGQIASSTSQNISASAASTAITAWNENFQNLVRKSELENPDKLFKKWDELAILAKDFLHVASVYGRIIISEV
jgi:hypothetical protein